MSFTPALQSELPDDLKKLIDSRDGATSSTLLAVHRTRLAVRRTGLSDLRSHLAKGRLILLGGATAVWLFIQR